MQMFVYSTIKVQNKDKATIDPPPADKKVVSSARLSAFFFAALALDTLGPVPCPHRSRLPLLLVHATPCPPPKPPRRRV